MKTNDMPKRTVMRYHGGKMTLRAWIISYLAPHRVYVEPYCGAASVLMGKPRSYGEIINDLDGQIVNVFCVLRNPTLAERLRQLIELTPFSRADFEQSYETSGDRIEQARRTIFRSHAGFGSGAASGHDTGFRASVSRSYTTPAQDWASYPGHISSFTERLRGVVIESRPALDLIAAHDGDGVLFYCDPPYPHSTRSQKRRRSQMYNFEMTDDDHRELAKRLRSIKGMAVISGYPCPLYDVEIYPDWRRVEKQTCADGARKRIEVLWISPKAWEARKASLYPLLAGIL